MSLGYNTRQKEYILNFLKNNESKAYTSDALWNELKKEGISVGKTTVYRFLESLSQAGKVKKIKLDDNKSVCYEFLKEDCNEHYHLKCVGCGELIHTDCSILSKMKDHFLSEHGFKVDNVKTVIYGRCEKCGSGNLNA